MKNKSVCFTGHRNVKVTSELIENLQTILEDLISQGVTEFYAGGALGWDTICASSIIRIREVFTQIKLHLVLPCPPKQQILKWNDRQKSEYNAILAVADSVEILSQEYSSDCMKKRNAKLVEYADYCVCYYRKRSASGTGQTVRMAQRKNIKIYNLAEKT